MTPDRQSWLWRWVSGLGRESAAPCPDPGTMAAFVDGRLDAPAREVVLEHLAECPSCRDLVTELSAPGDSTIVPPTTRPRLRTLAIGLALAAALVLCLTLLLGGDPPRLEERCRLAVEGLRAEEPELFQGFRLLDAAALDAGAVLRAGESLPLEPTGSVRERRPAFRWRAVPGATSYAVRLLTADGERVWRVTADRPALDYPADEPDLEEGVDYVWEVTGQGDVGTKVGTQGFRVLSAEGKEAVAAALRGIERGFADEDIDLGKAHYLIGRGLWSEAEAFAARFTERHPDEALGVQTRDAIRRRLGRDP